MAQNVNLMISFSVFEMFLFFPMSSIEVKFSKFFLNLGCPQDVLDAAHSE